MNRIKNIFTCVHIVLWILFSLLMALQLSQDDPRWLESTAGVIVTCLYVFYLNFFLLTRYPGKKERRAYYYRLAAVVLSGPFLFMIVNWNKTAMDPFLGYYFLGMVTIVPIFLLLSWLARTTENLVLNTIRKEQLEKQSVETELNYLKAQINPHFLFNTLNNIHTLVYTQAPTAPEAVMHLSSLMRYMIYESNARTVPLDREIEYLNDYVSLQQLRYKANPVVDLKIEGDSAKCQIAPLLFIHLLENAYKHSPGRLNPGDIKVRIEVSDDMLKFDIQNPIGNSAVNSLDEPGGIGLPNIQKRLQLLYPDAHSLEISSSDGQYFISLKIYGTFIPS